VNSGTDEERDILYLRRIDELERRLAHLESALLRLGVSAAFNDAPSPPDPALGVQEAETATVQEATNGADAEHEGARMVVMEMLTSGYEPGEVAAYLRQTFGVSDPEALFQEVGVPG
jgi:hypothetical protein